MKPFWRNYGYAITCVAVLLVGIYLGSTLAPRWMLLIGGFVIGAWTWQQLSIKFIKRDLNRKLDAELFRSRKERLLPGAEDQIALFQVRDRDGKLHIIGDIKDTLSADDMKKLALWIYGLSREIQAKADDLERADEDDKAQKSGLN